MKNSLLEIWGDVVEARSLVYSIIIITTLTMGAHLMAPSENGTLGLFFGIGGAVTGFFLCVYLFKPRRIITEEEDK